MIGGGDFRGAEAGLGSCLDVDMLDFGLLRGRGGGCIVVSI